MTRLNYAVTTATYFLILVCSLNFLAAVQLRSSGGASYDTWRLNYGAHRDLLDTRKRELKSLLKNLSSSQEWLDFAKQCATLYGENGQLKSEVEQSSRDDAKELKELQKDPKSRQDYNDISPSAARCIYRGHTILQWDIAYYTYEVAENEKHIHKAQEEIQLNDAQYAKIIEGKDEFIGLVKMEKDSYIKFFIRMPYDLLVLGLVLSMGALGGMVRILRRFCESEEGISLKDYIMWPFIGAVVAIGGYVLAKTGLVLLSSTGGDLSPFMVGFVGIVSGLLAKEMIDHIARLGIKIMGDSK